MQCLLALHTFSRNIYLYREGTGNNLSSKSTNINVIFDLATMITLEYYQAMHLLNFLTNLHSPLPLGSNVSMSHRYY